MICKFWMLAAAALTLGMAQSPAIAQQYGPPTSGSSSAITFVPAVLSPVAGGTETPTKALNGPGSSGNGGPATAAQLNYPVGMAYDSNGNLFFADESNYVVRRIDHVTGDISIFAGTNGTYGLSTGGGVATNAQMGNISGLVIDSNNNVYVSDRLDNNIIWKITPGGAISIFAGGGSTPSTCSGSTDEVGDGCLATQATLNNPWALGIDSNNNIYIADSYNELVREVSASTGIITAYAGVPSDAGTSGECSSDLYTTSTGPYLPSQAHLCFPDGIAFDHLGNTFIAEAQNNFVREIDGSTGYISIFAGTGTRSSTGNGGPAIDATLNEPAGIYIDAANRVYISDFFGGEIRMVDSTGNITDVMGTSQGELVAASFGEPDTESLFVDGEFTGAANGIYAFAMDIYGNIVATDSNGDAITTAGASGGGAYYFGNQQIYQTVTTTSLNALSALYPPYVLISNPSGVDLTFPATPTVTGPFAIAGGTCTFPGTVTPGQSCTVILSFTPTADQSYTGTVTLNSNANSSPNTISLSGAGIGIVYPSATLLPNPVPNFTSPATVTSAAQVVTLTNTGPVPLTIGGTDFDGADPTNFAVLSTTCPSGANTLAAGDSCVYNITFTPTAATTYVAGFQVDITTQNYGYLSTFLSGTGTAAPPPAATLSPNPLAFGGQVVSSTSPAQIVTLSNTGSTAITGIVPTLTGANAGDFALLTTGTNVCGASLAAASTCNFYITFTPAATGSRTATLSVADSDPSSPQTASLTGTGVQFQSNVGTAEAAQTVTVYITTAGREEAINLMTDGAANIDYAINPGGTCTEGTVFAVGDTCSVNVSFLPLFPGARDGAVEVLDLDGNLLGVTYFPGLGVGPEIAFPPAAPASITSTIAGLQTVAVDGGDDLFYVDGSDNLIKLPWNGSSYGSAVNIVNLSTQLGNQYASALAIDPAGNIFVGAGSDLVEVPWAGGTSWGTPVVLASTGVNDVYQIATDYSGDLYIADALHKSVVEMTRTATGFNAPVVLPFPGGGAFLPSGVAVNGSNDVFACGLSAISGDGEVLELPWTGNGYGTMVTIPAPNADLTDMAVDGDGDIYLSAFFSSAEIMWIPNLGSGNGYGKPAQLSPLSFSFFQLAVDGAGNVFAVDGQNGSGANMIVELGVANPPSLTFANTNVGSTSSDSPKTVTVYNIGNEDLYFLAQNNNPVYPVDFPINNKDNNLCSEDSSVNPGSSCDVSMNFTPTVAGSLSEDVVLTDNNLAGNTSTQSIPVKGNGIATTAPAVTLNPTSLTFSAPSGSTSAVQYSTLTNTGTAPLTITSTSITGTNASSFLEEDGCVHASPIAVNGTCSIAVKFAPTATGTFTAAISITDNASNSPQSLALSGNGTAAGAPITTLTPSLTFPATLYSEVNQLSATLSNTGNAPLTNISATITGVNSDVFSIYPNGSCYGVTTLAAGASCTISINFYSPGAGNFEAVLSVSDNAAGSPQTCILAGEGTQSELQFSPGQLQFIAGTPGMEGATGSGSAASALIGGGYGIALDSNGLLYFSDYENNTVWQIDSSGNIGAFAGMPEGSGGHGSYSGDGGPAASATLDGPEQIAFDPSGNLYIADRLNNLIRVVNPVSGDINTFAGHYGNGFGGYAGDGGPATQATLSSPLGVAADGQGNIYIADTNNFVIRKVDTTGTITLFAGTPSVNGYSGDNGPATSAKLGQCYQLATDQNGNVYIADYGNGVVRKVDSSGIITTYAGGGTAAVTSTPQPATSVNLNNGPVGLATDPAGNLYVLGLGSTNSPGVFVVNASQQISQIVGGGSTIVNGGAANFEDTSLNAIAVDGSGDLYVDDASEDLVSEIGSYGDLVFPNTPVNSTSAPLTVTLSNTGNAPLSFSGQNEDVVAARSRKAHAAITGSAQGGHPDVVDFNNYGNISGPFAIASGGTCNFDDGIAAGASCTMNVTFSPTAAGPATGKIELFTDKGNYSNIQNVVLLSGNGTAVTTPAATLTPSLAFPNTNVGVTSSALAATLSNTGNATLTISNIAIGGTNPSDFAIATGSNACGTSLPASASCSIYVTFTPASAATFSGTLTVTDNASPTTQSAALTGTGTTPPAPIATLTSTLSFPSTLAGSQSAAMTATLSNSGNASLTISSIALAGTNPTDFTISSGSNACGTTLAADASCLIYVVFNPASAASFSATLNVTDNAAGSPQSATLTGTGLPPPDFTLSATPATQSIAAGAAATYTVTVASINGSFSGEVALTASGLPPGATASFAPAQVSASDGSATSTLTVQTAGAPSAQSRGSLWPFATPALALLLMVPFRRWRKAFRGKLMLLLVGVASLAAAGMLSACGGGFALTNQSKTYTITVTGASGADTHTTTVQLTVQ